MLLQILRDRLVGPRKPDLIRKKDDAEVAGPRRLPEAAAVNEQHVRGAAIAVNFDVHHRRDTSATDTGTKRARGGSAISRWTELGRAGVEDTSVRGGGCIRKIIDCPSPTGSNGARIGRGWGARIVTRGGKRGLGETSLGPAR